MLTLCHTVIPERIEKGRITYTGLSPDEVALIRGAKLLGFKLDRRTFDRVVVKEVLMAICILDVFSVMSVF